MSFFSALRVAIDALFVNQVRTVLTSLGIVIGTAAVIALVSAGEGAHAKLDERLDSIGKTLILVRPGARSQAGPVAGISSLTLADAEAIRREVGSNLSGVAALQMAQRVVVSRTAAWPTTVVGSMPEMFSLRAWKVTLGRFYNNDDVKKLAPVCILGATVRKKLFPTDPDPIGEWVRVDNLRLRVIGVLTEKGRTPTGGDQDDQICVPLPTLQRKLIGNDKLSMILATARSEATIERAKNEIVGVMRKQHRVKPGAEDFDVSSVQEMAEIAVVFTQTMQLLVVVIASISLVVGGIGIMNIMLVSVTERTREIGVRMAVGAAPGDVLTQFLMEAVTLALLGGILGVTLGIAGAMSLSHLASWPLIISPGVVFLSFLLSGGVGVFFGYYPAWKASRLQPIEALRHE